MTVISWYDRDDYKELKKQLEALKCPQCGCDMAEHHGCLKCYNCGLTKCNGE